MEILWALYLKLLCGEILAHVGILWALYLKLLCRGNIMGIVPEVVMWRDIGARIQR
ncbi:hypothetical protein HBQ68_01900 [Staphylococcus aureus]|nr:hypothetical protein [Staphylococcus aureus]